MEKDQCGLQQKNLFSQHQNLVEESFVHLKNKIYEYKISDRL